MKFERRVSLDFIGGPVVKNPRASAGDTGDGFDHWVGRKWQPTPIFMPGESHGQRRLAGYRVTKSRTQLTMHDSFTLILSSSSQQL